MPITQTPTPVATATPTVTPTPSDTPYPPIVACLQSQLSVVADAKPAWTDGNQAAIYLVVTNISDSMCSITGYPLVAAYGPDGHALTVAFEHGSFGAVPIADPLIYRTPVIPGETAFAGLTWPTGFGTGCSRIGSFHVSLPGVNPVPVNIAVISEICTVGSYPAPLAATAINPGESFQGNQYKP